MVGRTYLERGRPVVVVARWAGKGLRNVWIRREDGTQDVRPFRGLRKTSAGAIATSPVSAGGENGSGPVAADEGGPDVSTSPGPAPRSTTPARDR